MGRFNEMFNTLAASRKARWVGAPLVLAAAAATVISVSQTTRVSGTPPLVNLSAEPLYARGARAKPTLTLALSVEFPTVGAQYVSTPGATRDNSYSPDREYIGYFHADSCYLYNNNPTEVRTGNAPIENYRRFDRSGPATNRGCSDAFSGNFLNWATSSAIDILRYGLTGGDRVVDDNGLTVLQRAVLPNRNVSDNFFNASNFPAKILPAALAASAVPASLRGAWAGSIYVANCLNRVHFGTELNFEGDCDSPGNNSNLGAAAPTATPRAAGPVTASTNFGTSVFCANVGGNCTFPNALGVREVFYGRGTTWIRFPVTSAAGPIACGNNMTGEFNDPAPGLAKTCRFGAYAGPWQPYAQVTTGLSAQPFFYARVRVCESSANGSLLDPRTALCLRYPNGNFKPVGNLQRSADDVRVAAFGYLNDPGTDRYGGVLRAPMKYVGSRSYDSNFALSQTANTVQEWDPATGAFLRDPDNANGPNSGTGSNWPGERMSGVVNYLNQFGRTGVFGQYKSNDPVSELYYESLRYLQGLPPTDIPAQVGNASTTSAIAGINDAMRDGFPVYTTWTDPHPAVTGMTDYSCIKNNIVAIGDVNTHADKFIPGNNRVSSGDVARAARPDSNEPDFYNWTRVVGAFEEARTAQTYPDGNGTTRNVSNFNGANGNPDDPIEDNSPGTCCSNNSYYIAGIAYWANTHDIRGTGWTAGDGPNRQRPGMRVKTYILDVNEYGQQTPDTTRRRNQFYLAGKYGGFDDDARDARNGRPGVGNPFISMAASSASGATALIPSNSASAAFVVNDNSSWQRVSADASKREAKSYFLSSSAAEVLAALDQIFAEVRQQARSIAGGAISTQRLTTNTGYIYQAQFDPTDWSGDLLPVAISASGTGISVGDESTSPWRNAASAPTGAAGVLDGRNIASAPRNLYVGYNASASAASFGSSAFNWASIPTSIQTALSYSGNPASAGQTDANAQLRLNYLVGDRSQEAPTGVFRRRGSRLGDIVNSGVVYSGAPSPAVTQSAAYNTFRTTYANRARALFVGANDGMLHAFNADTGAEMFGYIPSWTVPRLSALTHPSYIHQSYQDATPAVAEVNLGTTTETWRTVLVSGSGGGGQGVFALNVTNPGTFTNDDVLWEFSDRDDPAMGNVIGRPQLLKLNVGTATTPVYRWFAVVASGVNNNANDGSASSGAPALFFLRLDKAKDVAWSEGTNQASNSSGNNYFKIVFPQNATDVANGMVGFSVRLGDAGQVSYIYAGDLQGNLWKLDMSAYQGVVLASTYSNGAAATVSAFSYFKNATNAAIPMYTAFNAAGTVRQPITMEPSLAFAANRSIIVSFGTGKFLESTDNAGPYGAQTVYALIDNNSTAADSSSPTAAISGRGRLRAPESVTATGVDFNPFVWGRATSDTDTGRSVTTVRSGWYFDYFQSATTGERQVSNFAIISGRLIFGSVIPAPDTCSSGDGNLYVVDLRAGDGVSTASTVGILGEPFLVQVGASTLSNSDTTGRRREQTQYQIILQGSAGSAAPPGLGFADVTWPGRLSWREISNYREIQATP